MAMPASAPSLLSDLLLLQFRRGDSESNNQQLYRLIRDGILGRPIEPEQVADAVAFLSSRRAGILSGVMLNLGN